jgi:hypothetical protein
MARPLSSASEDHRRAAEVRALAKQYTADIRATLNKNWRQLALLAAAAEMKHDQLSSPIKRVRPI